MSDRGEGEPKPDGSKVFLHNLPYGFEKRDYEDLFAKHNLREYKDIDVMKGRDGRSKGMASVTLGSSEEVEDAIQALNDQEVDGRKMTCREDRGSGYAHPASMERSEGKKGKGKGKKGGKGWGKWDDWGRGGGYRDRYDSPRRRGGRRDDSRGRGRGGGRDRDASRGRDRSGGRGRDRDRSGGRKRRSDSR